MSVVIKKLEETGVTHEELFSLIKEVFLKREEEGIHVSYTDFTIDDFNLHVKDAIVFVAVDEKNGKPVGMVSLRLFRDGERLREYGYEELLAVSNTVQRLGVGSQLFKAEKMAAKDLGLSYIKSDTSVKATSSVTFHKKRGYIINGYQSSGLTNTYSYTFILPIKRSIKTTQLYCKVRFLLLFIIIRLSKDSEGNYYPIGKMLRKLKIIS